MSTRYFWDYDKVQVPANSTVETVIQKLQAAFGNGHFYIVGNDAAHKISDRLLKLDNIFFYDTTQGFNEKDQMLINAINHSFWQAADKIVLLTDDNYFRQILIGLKNRKVATVVVVHRENHLNSELQRVADKVYSLANFTN